MGRRADLVAAIAPVAPPCFEARSQWVAYLQSAAEAHKSTKVFDDPGAVVLLMEPHPHINPHFAFCRDCSAIHSDRMYRAGKCHPNHLKELHARALAADDASRVEAPGLPAGAVSEAGNGAGSSARTGAAAAGAGCGEGRPQGVPGVPALSAQQDVRPTAEPAADAVATLSQI